MVIVSASGTVETVTEKEDGATPPDGSVFIKARWSSGNPLNLSFWLPLKILGVGTLAAEEQSKTPVCKVSFADEVYKNQMVELRYSVWTTLW